MADTNASGFDFGKWLTTPNKTLQNKNFLAGLAGLGGIVGGKSSGGQLGRGASQFIQALAYQNWIDQMMKRQGRGQNALAGPTTQPQQALAPLTGAPMFDPGGLTQRNPESDLLMQLLGRR